MKDEITFSIIVIIYTFLKNVLKILFFKGMQIVVGFHSIVKSVVCWWITSTYSELSHFFDIVGKWMTRHNWHFLMWTVNIGVWMVLYDFCFYFWDILAFSLLDDFKIWQVQKSIIIDFGFLIILSCSWKNGLQELGNFDAKDKN